jgi:hypothetical protein
MGHREAFAEPAFNGSAQTSGEQPQKERADGYPVAPTPTPLGVTTHALPEYCLGDTMLSGVTEGETPLL